MISSPAPFVIMQRVQTWVWRVLLSGLVIASAVFLLRTLDRGLIPDELIYMQLTKTLAGPDKLYLAAVDHSPPGQPVMGLPFYWLLGHTVLAAKAAVLCYTLLFAVSVGWIAYVLTRDASFVGGHQRVPPVARGEVYAAALVGFVASLYGLYIGVNPSSYAEYALVGGVACAVTVRVTARRVQRFAGGWLVAGGALAGLGVMTKPSVALEVAALLLLIYWLRRSWRDVVIFAAGAVLVIAAFFVYFAAVDTLTEMIYVSFAMNLSYIDLSFLGSGLFDVQIQGPVPTRDTYFQAQFVERTLPFLSGLIVAAGMGLIATLYDRWRDRGVRDRHSLLLVALLLWLLAALVESLLPVAMALRYYFPLIAPLALLAGLQFSRVKHTDFDGMRHSEFEQKSGLTSRPLNPPLPSPSQVEEGKGGLYLASDSPSPAWLGRGLGGGAENEAPVDDSSPSMIYAVWSIISAIVIVPLLIWAVTVVQRWYPDSAAQKRADYAASIAFLDDTLDKGDCVLNWGWLAGVTYFSNAPPCARILNEGNMIPRGVYDVRPLRAWYLEDVLAKQPELFARQPTWSLFPQLDRLIALRNPRPVFEDADLRTRYFALDWATYHAGAGGVNGELDLLGYDLAPGRSVAPGDTISVTLVWRVDHTPDYAYQGFVHLVQPGNAAIKIAAQDDTPADLPFILPDDPPETLATDHWRAGDVVVGRTYRLTVPANTPPGEYALITGMYRWSEADGFQPVPHTDTNGESVSALALGMIVVAR